MPAERTASVYHPVNLEEVLVPRRGMARPGATTHAERMILPRGLLWIGGSPAVRACFGKAAIQAEL